MNSDEQQLIIRLAEMGQCLRFNDKRWSDKFNEDSVRAREHFNRDAEVKDKYDLVRQIYAYYESGMGGLHEVVPEECVPTKTALFQLVNALLRVYWKELGRETHDYSSYEIIPEGTHVRLLPNTVIYQRPDFEPAIVPDTDEVAKQVWSIIKCEGPDVTNMPSYAIWRIKGGASVRSARQESLAIIAMNPSGK